MIIKLNRFADNSEATASLLYVNDRFFCYALEDQKQQKKIKGETRIPAGTYQVAFRMCLSPKTESYRARFPWFTYHLQLLDVPYFEYVYIHVGNTDDHTEGCILVGDTINNLNIDRGFLGSSTNAFKRLYETISQALKAGEQVSIIISD